eukprot:6990865-Karenia_brevis.AAC.1
MVAWLEVLRTAAGRHPTFVGLHLQECQSAVAKQRARDQVSVPLPVPFHLLAPASPPAYAP